MITVRKIALPLALVLVSAGCVAGPGDAADKEPVGQTTEACVGWGGPFGGFGWGGPRFGGPWPGFPYVCDGTGACFSPLEGDVPWL